MISWSTNPERSVVDSPNEIDKSYKKHILEFQKDISNITNQHLSEAFPPSSLGSSTYSNKEAMKFSIDAVNKAGKIIGQAQKRVVDIFTSDLKNKNRRDKKVALITQRWI